MRKSIFPEEILLKVPIYYRFMVKDIQKRVPELYKNARFSKSIRHRSTEYMSYDSYKPISSINYSKCESDEKNIL